MGRHSVNPPTRHALPRGVVGWVNAIDRRIHALTQAAIARGRLPGGEYVAVCRSTILPASLTEGGRGWCAPCRQWCNSSNSEGFLAIPQQRAL